jgi:hypothetical protein
MQKKINCNKQLICNSIYSPGKMSLCRVCYCDFISYSLGVYQDRVSCCTLWCHSIYAAWLCTPKLPRLWIAQ